MSDALRSELAGTAGLWVAFAVAVALTFARRGWRPDAALPRLAWLAIAVQTAHFSEEWITGFRMQFPAALGLAEWSAAFFVSFNAAWIVVWIAALVALRRGVRVAVLPVWFLGLGMVANGVAHPLLALAAGRYFPGLYTAPVEGIVGVVLLMKLGSATRPAEPPLRSAH